LAQVLPGELFYWSGKQTVINNVIYTQWLCRSG
jgi:hypothetical protein